jgi:hypothetical protein
LRHDRVTLRQEDESRIIVCKGHSALGKRDLSGNEEKSDKKDPFHGSARCSIVNGDKAIMLSAAKKGSPFSRRRQPTYRGFQRLPETM